jgi:hypothetical protein
MLAGDGQIATDADGNAVHGSGPNLMNGMCLNCHTAASSKDYIFTDR